MGRPYGYTNDEGMDSPEHGFHRGVGRIAAILEFVGASAGGLRLREIVAHLKAPKSSVHGLLRGLVLVGYLSERDGIYTLGPALAVLVGRMGPKFLVDLAHSELEQLVAETDETAILGMQAGASIVYVDQVESRQRVRYAAALFERRSLLHSSMGKLHMAYMEPSALQELLRNVKESSEFLDSRPAELQAIRKNRVAYNKGETVDNVTAVASGIWQRECLVGAISVAGPTERVSPRLDGIASSVRKHAEQITEMLRTGDPPIAASTGFSGDDRALLSLNPLLMDVQ